MPNSIPRSPRRLSRPVSTDTDGSNDNSSRAESGNSQRTSATQTDNDDKSGIVTIQVSKAFAEQAALNTITKLQGEISVLEDTLKENQACNNITATFPPDRILG
uniref:Uncharacterized protein n=1 Tax=Moniliophthora roreri TaxID=221103 RepID=A0A0W0FL29_MONRR